MALTLAQIAKASVNAQIAYCLDKQPTYDAALAEEIEALVAAPLLERIAALEAQVEQAAQPVLVVEREPDYWSGGHFHKGEKPHVDPTKVWALPIGTKLYTAPPKAVPLTDEQIDKAAKVLSHCMDYPWEHMPEAGRLNMRKNARTVIEAAIVTPATVEKG